MSNYPTNEKPCDYDGCHRTDTTPCIIIDHRPVQYSFRQYISWFGIHRAVKHIWQLQRDGFAEFPPEYYCPEHAKDEGFCWGCGGFWAGADDGFDFRGEWLCPNCRVDLCDYPDCDDGWSDDEYLYLWADYPGELLVENLDFVGQDDDIGDENDNH